MENRKCVRIDTDCIGRERFAINGKYTCCKEEIADECWIAQCAVDAIEDSLETMESILHACSRISFASEMICPRHNVYRREILNNFRRFALLTHSYQERIVDERGLIELVSSFMNIVKRWFSQSLLEEKEYPELLNYGDSIKADLNTLELALGACALLPPSDEELDDLFF